MKSMIDSLWFIFNNYKWWIRKNVESSSHGLF